MKAGDNVIYGCLASQLSPLPQCILSGHWAMSRWQSPLSVAKQALGLLRNWEISLRFVPGLSPKVALSTAGGTVLNAFELQRVTQNCSFDILLGISKLFSQARRSGLPWHWLLNVLDPSRCEAVRKRQDSGAPQNWIQIQPLPLITLGKLLNLSLNLLFLFCKHGDTSISLGFWGH